MLVVNGSMREADGGSLLQSMYRFGSSRGVIFWHNSILSLMNLSRRCRFRLPFVSFHLVISFVVKIYRKETESSMEKKEIKRNCDR